MPSDFWRFFHDGTITQIRGSICGDVELQIEIQYLRAMFPDKGESFIVRLNDCTCVEYQEWEGTPTNSFEAIRSIEPEIVSIKSLGPPILNCVTGTLKLIYGQASVSTDANQELTYAQLETGARAYWDAWRTKWRDSGNF